MKVKQIFFSSFRGVSNMGCLKDHVSIAVKVFYLLLLFSFIRRLEKIHTSIKIETPITFSWSIGLRILLKLKRLSAS